eukprot:1175984-Prorocentrum_minimum.AAC.1
MKPSSWDSWISLSLVTGDHSRNPVPPFTRAVHPDLQFLVGAEDPGRLRLPFLVGAEDPGRLRLP